MGEKKKDTVTIPMPPQWGTFVIKAEDGRVIVVDKDGEFDSGPQKAVSEQQRPWVKAASTVEPTSPTRTPSPPSPTETSQLYPSVEETLRRKPEAED